MVAAAGSVPAHCRVDGHATSSGNDVNFRLALPEGWNGKFLFLGVGGLGGTIANLSSGLMRGYASASTDTGHVASDRTWWSNRDKEIDYGYRGTHVTAVASKALTASFYGKPPQHAYFSGCSNGGRQAMMEVQRYPEDFDGVIAGHPATGTTMQVGRAIVYQHMLASSDNLLTDEAIEQLSKATLAACDKNDGLEDGLITDPRACTFDVDTLTSLTPGQRIDDQEDLRRPQDEGRQDLRARISDRPRRRHHRLARVDLGREPAGEAARWIAGVRSRAAAEPALA